MAGRRLATLCNYFRHNKACLSTSPTHQRLCRLTSLVSTHCRGFATTANRNGNKVEVNGVNIHYEQIGTGDHVVLLLPGALGCAQTDFPQQLAEDGLDRDKYTVVGFDPRGCGQSRPPDRDWPLMFYQRDAEDAATLMQTLGFPRYSVLGWSDGGITGMILASCCPGNVRKLLMWGANAFFTEKDIEMYHVIEDLDKWSERMRAPFLEVYEESYFRSQLKQWADAVRRFMSERNGDICVGSLPNIKCKTLIINGLKDALVPQEHPHFLHKHITNCRMVDWPEGKHNLHMRFHQEFKQVAEEFLDEPEGYSEDTESSS